MTTNENPQAVSMFAPASVGNFSVGFDALGAALAPEDGSLLGDVVTVRSAIDEAPDLTVTGSFAHALPKNPEENIVTACRKRLERELGENNLPCIPVQMNLEKRMPIGSGLGSSASSIVAALAALNRFHGNRLSKHRLLDLAGEMEGRISGEIHLDNVAPSMMGGLQLCPPGGEGHHGLPWPRDWRIVVCWPGTEQSTREAREVLPAAIPRGDAILQAANFARFVHALHAGDPAEAASCIQDLIAEPHRMALLPGFEAARDAVTAQGALAAGISGSGPTVFVLTDHSDVARACADWLTSNYVQNPAGFTHVCRLDVLGARAVGS